MSDYVRYREEKGLSNNQIIRTVAEGYPGYTKIQNTMVNNPQKYGICLLPEAEKLLDQEAVYLSAGLINLLNLIPVDTIYLAGDICYHYELLAQRLQREIRAKALDRSRSEIQIYPSSQDPNVGVLAAAEVVFSRFFTM